MKDGAKAPIQIDEESMAVEVDGEHVSLGVVDLTVLLRIARDAGTPVPVEDVLEAVWNRGGAMARTLITDRSVMAHVRRIRDRLGPHADALQTVRDVGYTMDPDAVRISSEMLTRRLQRAQDRVEHAMDSGTQLDDDDMDLVRQLLGEAARRL